MKLIEIEGYSDPITIEKSSEAIKEKRLWRYFTIIEVHILTPLHMFTVCLHVCSQLTKASVRPEA